MTSTGSQESAPHTGLITARRHRQLAGLANVAALTFLAARAVPGGFVVALTGGIPLARAAERHGARVGYATATASLVETIAVMGPARLIVPLPHAASAPLLGVLHRRRTGLLALAAAGAAVRLVLYLASFAFYIFVVVGLEAYLGTYQELREAVGFLPAGTAAALWVTVAWNALWSSGAGLIQAWLLRRGLRRWPGDIDAAGADQRHLRAPSPARLDGRAVVAAGAVAFTVALVTIHLPVLSVVALWLAGAWLLAGAGLRPLLGGIGLAAPLALSALGFGLIGGVGASVALRRGLRVLLLVLVAFWLRAAAGPAGLRAVSVRMMRRLRQASTLSLAARVLGESAGAGDYGASARRLGAQLRRTSKRPLRILDATLDWIADEAGHLPVGDAPAASRRWTRTETALAVTAALLALTASAVSFA